MGRYFIHLAYNGANYNGWQTQPGLPTVQQTPESVLLTLLQHKNVVAGVCRHCNSVKKENLH
ncbi:MAG: hypothetical protein IKM79_03325 [Bacteroidales bacterium]|nr:hypothetical protein [Bacteroidales bacterium]